MRLSSERIKSLQAILLDHYGIEATNEQAQEAGMAIMHFVNAKSQRRQQLTNQKDNVNGYEYQRSKAEK